MKQGYLAGALALSLVAGFTSLQPVSLEARQAQANTATLPQGETVLGTVRLTHAVMADGKPLKAGTYRIRLTPDSATPVPPGQTAQLERWAEFLQGNKVVGREVVTIVPNNEISQVAKEKPPASGASKVELLKGNDYLRIWVNRGGNHYLIHLPTSNA